jgi:energy-converting hydrogenase A subunit G
VAGTGAIFYFLSKRREERFELIESISGYAWTFWIFAFFIFMVLPQYWFFGVMLAGSAILVKVTAKISLLGTFDGGEEHA